MEFKIQMTLSPLTRFLLKAGVIYIIWYLMYDYYLLPDGRLDAFLSLSGVNLAGGILNIFGWDIYSESRVLAITGTNSYPGGTILKRVMFLSGGIILLFVANVFRIMLFALSIYYVPTFWEQVHTYSSYFIFYPIVLTLWYIWTTMSDDDLLLTPAVK